MAGEYWVHRESVSNVVQYLPTLMQSHDEVRQKKFGLTPRELEIVSAVVAGYSNKEIAEYFKISEDTVEHHLSNICDKLGVSTRLELSLFGISDFSKSGFWRTLRRTIEKMDPIQRVSTVFAITILVLVSVALAIVRIGGWR